MRTSIPPQRPTALAVAVTALLALAVGCSGADQEMSSGDVAVGEAARDDGRGHPGAAFPPDGEVATRESVGGADTSGEAGVAQVLVQTRAVIRSGEVALVTTQMDRARRAIDDLLGRYGGYLAREDTTNNRAGRPERSVLVLRVPEPAFDTVMKELGEIGRTRRTDRSAEDVTTQVIDVDTRVASQEASIARLQRLLRRATTVEDLIRVEAEIARRQAALESLKAQQEWLGDQTSMATVTVRLRAGSAPPPPQDASGFLAGLAQGWQALTAVLVTAATVTGAVLPFVVTLALLGVPAWLLLRSAVRHRRRPEAAAVPAPPDPS